MIAVVIGATGLVGKEIVTKLIADRDISQVIAISRRAMTYDDRKFKNILISNLENLKQHREELKGDLYFCCLGTTIKTAGNKKNFRKVDFTAVVDFSKIAEFHKAQSLVVVSASGASSKSHIFYNRTKGQAEVELLKLRLPSLTIFQPALLMGDREEFRPLERFFIKSFRQLEKVISPSVRKHLMTDVDHLANRMITYSKEQLSGASIIQAHKI